MSEPAAPVEHAAADAYPVRVQGALDPQLSRWLWLVKWVLAIPHFIVLTFLWAAFFVLSIVALAAIVITGRYPRSLFEFNTGVLRWSWRVAFYSYGALGTDRYPPFTLSRVPDYPASLEVTYPERLSRGLALVKWWLLAIPQYIVLSFFVGATPRRGWPGAWAGGVGLIEVLTCIAGVILLVTRRYPRGVFDLVMGLDRWVLRVAAYAGLMTDRYPPFRLDQGGAEPDAAVAPAEPSPVRWTGGRVATVVVGSILALISFGMVVGGCAGLAIDQTQRDADGYLMTPGHDFGTTTYALESTTIDLHSGASDLRTLLGGVRVTSTSNRRLFVGLGPAADVNRYLATTAHATVTRLGQWGTSYAVAGSGPPTGAPAGQRFWVASSSGAGEQHLDWRITGGRWRLVVMNADASRGLGVTLRVGARLPHLRGVAVGVLAGGLVIALLAALIIHAAVPRSRTTDA
jgi:uncharacterized protein DUF4389